MLWNCHKTKMLLTQKQGNAGMASTHTGKLPGMGQRQGTLSPSFVMAYYLVEQGCLMAEKLSLQKIIISFQKSTLVCQIWTHAIFLLPNIFYASHACYSERVLSEGEQWCVVIKAYVEPSSFTSHEPTTTFQKDPIDGEPDTAEYRILIRPEHDTILRVESARNVVASSILFIKLDFLESAEGEDSEKLAYNDLLSYFVY